MRSREVLKSWLLHRTGAIVIAAVIILVLGGVAVARELAAASERDDAIAAATAFARSFSTGGQPQFVGAVKGGVELISADQGDPPPTLQGQQFWLITFSGDFLPLRPPPALSTTPTPTSSASTATPTIHHFVVYVQTGRVVGGHGRP